MIRINLLGIPKPKRGKRTSVATPTISGEGPNPMVVVLLLTVLALGGNGWYWWHLDVESKRIAHEREVADAENRRLAQVKAKYEEAEKQKELYRKRIEVIERLRTAQSGPVDLLNTIGDTVNATDAVWLSTMKEEGNNINIEGMALGANAVANLITNLKKTGFFKSVEIKETFQDDSVRDMQSFQFTLTLEKGEKQEKKS